jgi:hypothetical protein
MLCEVAVSLVVAVSYCLPPTYKHNRQHTAARAPYTSSYLLLQVMCLCNASHGTCLACSCNVTSGTPVAWLRMQLPCSMQSNQLCPLLPTTPTYIPGPATNQVWPHQLLHKHILRLLQVRCRRVRYDPHASVASVFADPLHVCACISLDEFLPCIVLFRQSEGAGYCVYAARHLSKL